MADTVAAAAPLAWEGLRAELLRFVRSRVGDAAAADDVVHDVLLRALAALEGPRPPVHLRAWLYRATRNAIVDHYRARRPVALAVEAAEEEGAAAMATAESADDASAEQELARCLEPMLAALPPDQREALALAEVQGLTQREVAARAGLSLSGAKSRVQRARRHLRAAVLACCRVEVDRRGGVVDFRRRGGVAPGCGDGSRRGGRC
ncbi:MAG: sigma-70 family RNA polymerase sigma factor [Thermoanaerobaculia bacterium]|nr:sigma-70 family RNA polymerase sigma factor [Thermoanaerobaculia bacterium]